MIECPDCDGTGQDPDDGVAFPCATCDGLGEVDGYQLAEDRAYSAAEARWQDDRGLID